MNIYQKIINSRFFWFLQGLPDFHRAYALFAIRRHTMTSARRSKLLWQLCTQVLRNQITGDFVECGVWRGGSAGLMGLALQSFDHNHKKKLHLFDSFEGLPEPSIADGVLAAEYSRGANSGKLASINQCVANVSDVQNFIFNELNLSKNLVTFHKGWFQDTLPNIGNELENVSLLRLDGDWYESTKICLEAFYDCIPRGGIILLDDYFCWEGCKKATDNFRAKHRILSKIIQIDRDSAYWVKH
jgi:O-methyltransferase